MEEMSKNYSLLFVWSKGASTRRKILKIIVSENNKGNPIYISKLTNLFNSLIEFDEKPHTISSIRKNIKLLKEYGIIRAINEGGRPEYLELTEEGWKILEKMGSKSKVIPKIV